MSLRRATLESYDEHDLDPIDARAPAPDATDRVRTLYRVIDGLAVFDRALLLLHLEGYRNAEIGDILGLSATNVSTKLSRLRSQLRTQLTSDNPAHS